VRNEIVIQSFVQHSNRTVGLVVDMTSDGIDVTA
jgi:hypothetical protein